MRVKLIRDSRILHKAGEIIEVSPAEASFLLSVQSAIEVREQKTVTEKVTTRKRGAKPNETSDRNTSV